MMAQSGDYLRGGGFGIGLKPRQLLVLQGNWIRGKGALQRRFVDGIYGMPIEEPKTVVFGRGVLNKPIGILDELRR